MSRIAATAREREPEVEVRQLTPDEATAEQVAGLIQPSLFGERRVVAFRSAQDLGKDIASMLVKYLDDPSDDVILVLAHAGGKKGKALLDAAKRGSVPTINCPKITKQRDRLDFVRAEVHGAGRVITEDAARFLLDAVGGGLRELANACDQLVADTPGTIDEDAVARYHQGKAEVSGFTIADRAVEGRTADALEQLRWALSTGVPAVLIVSALAQNLRAIAQVGGARSAGGSGGAGLAKQLGMPPWKVDRARQQLRGWAPDGVSDAMRAVAEADAQVKGGAADAEYALERAVLTVSTSRRGR